MVIPESVKFIYSFIWERKYFIYFLFLGIINILFDIYEPFFARELIDKSINKMIIAEIINLGSIWIIILISRYFSKFISSKINLKYSNYVIANIQLAIYKHILKLPISYFKEKSIGYIMSRQLDDVAGLEGLMLNNIINGMLAIIEIILILIIMVKISIILTVISILIMGMDIFINFSFSLKQLYKNFNEAKANLNKELQDTLSGIKLVKTSNAIQYEEKRYKNILNNYYTKKNIRDNINIIRGSVTNFINELSIPLIIIIGSIFVYQNFMSMGELMAFILYFQKSNNIFGSAVSMIPLFKISQASAERIFELFEIQTEKCDLLYNSKKVTINKYIEFKNICFSYGENNILNNVNLKISSKKITAIVGLSGSGKSTIIDLLLRFCLENSGQILIDGKNINEYEINTIRNSIAYLSQESILFNRTLVENLVYNLQDKNIDDNLINEALNKAFAIPIINNMPDKLNTIIGDKGNTISGGEKQRICIAREILKNVDIFIFDEATSALDSISEDIIQSSINGLSKTKTIIIIAHRLSTIRNADVIYALDRGTIAEFGTHETLLKKKGVYYSLYLKQQDYQGKTGDGGCVL